MLSITKIKDQRGTIEIQVELFINIGCKEPYWGINVFFTPPGKRKQLRVPKEFDLVTKQEIHDAKLALWEDLKPKL